MPFLLRRLYRSRVFCAAEDSVKMNTICSCRSKIHELHPFSRKTDDGRLLFPGRHHGKLVQLQSLHTWACEFENEDCDDVRLSRGYLDDASYGALSNLHTLECDSVGPSFERYLACQCIPMKILRILKCGHQALVDNRPSCPT